VWLFGFTLRVLSGGFCSCEVEALIVERLGPRSSQRPGWRQDASSPVTLAPQVAVEVLIVEALAEVWLVELIVPALRDRRAVSGFRIDTGLLSLPAARSAELSEHQSPHSTSGLSLPYRTSSTERAGI
jgi:hypothetical protein